MRLAKKEKKAILPPGAQRSPKQSQSKRGAAAASPKKEKPAGVLKYQEYDMNYLQNEEKGDLLEIQKKYYLHDHDADADSK